MLSAGQTIRKPQNLKKTRTAPGVRKEALWTAFPMTLMFLLLVSFLGPPLFYVSQRILHVASELPMTSAILPLTQLSHKPSITEKHLPLGNSNWPEENKMESHSSARPFSPRQLPSPSKVLFFRILWKSPVNHRITYAVTGHRLFLWHQLFLISSTLRFVHKCTQRGDPCLFIFLNGYIMASHPGMHLFLKNKYILFLRAALHLHKN